MRPLVRETKNTLNHLQAAKGMDVDSAMYIFTLGQAYETIPALKAIGWGDVVQLAISRAVTIDEKRLILDKLIKNLTAYLEEIQ